ncbi:hypothetical protein Aoki45_14710 [Algoriphagus sp. oki45]|uniref:hypothetical protein n=1 Tax=Algoriphagus sp. oki45 TaxID=3067294 RepID=UPI0027F06470|nr:hypothetical protein Aoki45_14710 [Algoriphagus sp. oki45]
MKNLLLVYAAFVLLQFPLQAQEIPMDSLYLPGERIKEINDPALEEVSGLAFSRIQPNLLYLHVDSGGESVVFLMDSLGKSLGKINLLDTPNRDWEDIAVGPGPKGKSYVYVGEIGDNAGIYPEIRLYRFSEPEKVTSSLEVQPEVAVLNYPDGAKDAETLMVDPWTGEIYILSKRDEKNTLYRVPKDAFSKKKSVLEELIKLPFSSAVAGDISADGTRILIKNYFAVYYWERKKGESLTDALSRMPVRLPYVPEPQGEAIGFSPSGKSYFTVSEKRFNIQPFLYRYPSKD